MNRREALRILSAGAVLPLGHAKWLPLREARLFLGELKEPRTLNAHQFATVQTMAEMIIPRTDTPGATDAKATEFIDLILTEWYGDDERNKFLRGVDDVDTRGGKLFGKTFVDCSTEQQADILQALGAELLEEDTVRQSNLRTRGWMPRGTDSFYAMLRRLTMIAYYTSEAGDTLELKFEMIPGRYEGCISADEKRQGGDRESSQQ